ncbi:hypothetical protein DAI22_11g131700 [Oryza sativa Japonica Group]|nr:hypothetical protein DAI22_11g131700 [Oryza sativa Japonica Group]
MKQLTRGVNLERKFPGDFPLLTRSLSNAGAIRSSRTFIFCRGFLVGFIMLGLRSPYDRSA